MRRHMDQKYFNRISAAKREAIYQAIHNELIRKEGFLNPNFKAKDLAVQYDFSPQDISAVTSVYFGSNFSMLLQRLRVSRVCQMLTNKSLSAISCEQIGLMCGFSNRQSLYNAFRKQQGITPLEYREKSVNTYE